MACEGRLDLTRESRNATCSSLDGKPELCAAARAGKEPCAYDTRQRMCRRRSLSLKSDNGSGWCTGHTFSAFDPCAATARCACSNDPHGTTLWAKEPSLWPEFLWPMPKADKLLHLVVPAKCGSTRFSQLQQLILTGALPRTERDLHSVKAFLAARSFGDWRRARPCEVAAEALSRRAVVLVIVRNPYERLLSGYLDKVAVTTGIRWLNPVFYANRQHFNATPPDFDFFVRATWVAVQRVGWHAGHGSAVMGPFGAAHLSPITASLDERVRQLVLARDRSSSAVSMVAPAPGGGTLGAGGGGGDDGEGGAAGGSTGALLTATASRLTRASIRLWAPRVRVLRLEEMASWYAPLVEELGLVSAVNHSAWRGGCFWKPPGGTCADALDVVAAAAAAAAGNKTRAKCGLTEEQRVEHTHGSCHLLETFYSSDLAAIVTQYAKDDLDAFGYVPWPGPRTGDYPTEG